MQKKLGMFSGTSEGSGILSWSEIKKRLKGRSERELIDLLKDCYKQSPEVKIKLSFAVSDNKEESSNVISVLKDRLHREFWTVEKNGAFRKPDMREARKIVTLAKNSVDDPEMIVDIMVDHFEHGVGFTAKHGDMWDGYYGSVENMFRKTCDYIVKNKERIDHERAMERIEKTVENSPVMGYGFYDYIVEMRDELKQRLGE